MGAEGRAPWGMPQTTRWATLHSELVASCRLLSCALDFIWSVDRIRQRPVRHSVLSSPASFTSVPVGRCSQGRTGAGLSCPFWLPVWSVPPSPPPHRAPEAQCPSQTMVVLATLPQGQGACFSTSHLEPPVPLSRQCHPSYREASSLWPEMDMEGEPEGKFSSGPLASGRSFPLPAEWM